jgi:hypothetical protein
MGPTEPSGTPFAELAVAVLPEQLRYQKQEVCGCRRRVLGHACRAPLRQAPLPCSSSNPMGSCCLLRVVPRAPLLGGGTAGSVSTGRAAGPAQGYAVRYSIHKHCVPAVLQSSGSPSLDTMPRMPVMAARAPLLLLVLATGA